MLYFILFLNIFIIQCSFAKRHSHKEDDVPDLTPYNYDNDEYQNQNPIIEQQGPIVIKDDDGAEQTRAYEAQQTTEITEINVPNSLQISDSLCLFHSNFGVFLGFSFCKMNSKYFLDYGDLSYKMDTDNIKIQPWLMCGINHNSILYVSSRCKKHGEGNIKISFHIEHYTFDKSIYLFLGNKYINCSLGLMSAGYINTDLMFDVDPSLLTFEGPYAIIGSPYKRVNIGRIGASYKNVYFYANFEIFGERDNTKQKQASWSNISFIPSLNIKVKGDNYGMMLGISNFFHLSSFFELNRFVGFHIIGNFSSSNTFHINTNTFISNNAIDKIKSTFLTIVGTTININRKHALKAGIRFGFMRFGIKENCYFSDKQYIIDGINTFMININTSFGIKKLYSNFLFGVSFYRHSEKYKQAINTSFFNIGASYKFNISDLLNAKIVKY